MFKEGDVQGDRANLHRKKVGLGSQVYFDGGGLCDLDIGRHVSVRAAEIGAVF